MAYAPGALRWLADQWEVAIPSAVFSGIVGDAAHTYGYHRAASELPKSDYSLQLVGDRPTDGIDMNAADAIDMNMSKADMMLVTRRVYDSWRDQNDPRLNYWREVIGTLDGVNVIYMDCQSGEQGDADDSHLWHMHAGGLRIHANNMDAMRALLSVITGKTVEQWMEDDMGMEWNAAWIGQGLATMADPVTVPVDPETGQGGGAGVPNKLAQTLVALKNDVAALKARPQVEAAPVDVAALVAALADPSVLSALAKAVADELHRRTAE